MRKGQGGSALRTPRTLLTLAFALLAALAPGLAAPCLAYSSPQLAAIDTAVTFTPGSVTHDVQRLGYYLGLLGSDDVGKARAVFAWIAHNVRYDAASYFAGKQPPALPADVLGSRLAVCQGYADLFTAVAGAAGLKAVTIGGLVKAGYTATAAGLGSHAWNAVQIGGKWRYLDCTWGAGHLDGSAFAVEYDDFYFLPDVAQLKVTHYSEDPTWVKEAGKMSKADFLKTPKVWPVFFKLGLQFRGGASKAQLKPGLFTRKVQVSVYAPAGVSLTAVSWPKGGQGGQVEVPGTNTRGVWQFALTPPAGSKSPFDLIVFATTDTGTTQHYTSAVAYSVSR